VMKEGDILTHCFHGFPDHGLFDDRGNVRLSVERAVEKGVVFDVGHGVGSFNWDVAERAFARGFLPQTISSDLHVYNINGPVYDLATTVSKFPRLGVSLDDALLRVTATPARVIHLQDKLGTLQVGAWGDAVIFALRQGHFELWDSHRQVRIGEQLLVPVGVVRAGRVYHWDEGDAGRPE